MAKIPQHKAQKRLENVVNKIMTKIKLAINKQQITWWIQQFLKNYCHFYLGQHINIQNLYTDKTKQLFDTTMRQLEQFNRPEILLNTAMDTITSNQLGKMTNAQFEELQTKITQIILEKEVQEII
ncbi:hypothetical protein G9A89_011420 [Geosiphon pyriformis]|nr:hypothetical protein G9A89_011420 [Geosiphon pyriformis]